MLDEVLAGIGHGDEVLISTFTFSADVNSDLLFGRNEHSTVYNNR